MKINLKYLFLFMFLLFVEIFIAMYIHDTFVRPYLGDVLVVILIYCFVQIFLQKPSKWLPIYIFIFSASIEILQLLNIVSILGLDQNKIAKIIIGTTFDFKDIACYFVGTLILIGWQLIKSTSLQMIVFFSSTIFSAIILMILGYNGFWWHIEPSTMGYNTKGVDVARYQGEIDWDLLKEQGISFAFAKATEGSSYKDPFFDKNAINAKQSGIKIGAYHFFSTETTGANQAENFIKTVYNYSMSLPPVLDFEIPNTEDNEEKERIINETKSFLLKVEKYLGVKPIIYTTYESYYAYLIKDFANYDYCFRDLIKKPSIPNGKIIIWQYSNRGRLKGIDPKQKYIDLNVMLNNYTE